MLRNNSHGGWRCRVKVRERQRVDERTFDYRIRRRKRDLRALRADTLARLMELEREGTFAES